jgi:hypothetical protein
VSAPPRRRSGKLVVRLPGCGGISAKADWWAGKDTLKNRFAALVEAEGEDAVRMTRREWEAAMQTRPDLAPSPATGHPSHMGIILQDMEDLHHSGRLPQKHECVWDLLHERDVVRQGSKSAALKPGTIENNLKGALRDLRAGHPLRALQDYRPKKRR